MTDTGRGIRSEGMGEGSPFKNTNDATPAVKFCLNCACPFNHYWNKRFDDAYKDKDCCCKKCEHAYARKSRPRVGKKYGATGYIYN